MIDPQLQSDLNIARANALRLAFLTGNLHDFIEREYERADAEYQRLIKLASGKNDGEIGGNPLGEQGEPVAGS